MSKMLNARSCNTCLTIILNKSALFSFGSQLSLFLKCNMYYMTPKNNNTPQPPHPPKKKNPMDFNVYIYISLSLPLKT